MAITSPPVSAGGPSYTDVFQERARRARRRSMLLLGIGGVSLFTLINTGTFSLGTIRDGIPAINRIVFEEGMPPDFSAARDWVGPLFDTLQMSIAGTALAIVLSFFAGLLAARTTTPHPIVYHITRNILNVLRAVPELIMGILFVAAVGLGLLPGVLALGLHSIGMVGKFFAESIEHVDPAPVEAVRATGAGQAAIVWHGVLPQVLPQMTDVSIYRWEYNFRASTVLSMVGCGGIGLHLTSALSLMEYQVATAVLLVILGMVIIVDGVGQLLRRMLK